MSESKKAESDKIWDEIKGYPIEAFGLANQSVGDHVKPLPVPGNVLYVKLAASAILPWLENALNAQVRATGRQYQVELHDGYVSVKRVEFKEETLQKALKSV